MTDKTKRALLMAAPGLLPLAAQAQQNSKKSAFITCPRAKGGLNAQRFPQVVVMDQYGRKSWFYEELIADRLAVVSFTSVRGEKILPVVDSLLGIHEELQKQLAHKVAIYTITTNPHEDTPEALRELAERKGAKWTFLTGSPESVKEVLASFNARGRLNALLWIGNEKTGRWINKPISLAPLFVAEAVARLSTGKDHRPFMVDMHSV